MFTHALDALLLVLVILYLHEVLGIRGPSLRTSWARLLTGAAHHFIYLLNALLTLLLLLNLFFLLNF